MREEPAGAAKALRHKPSGKLSRNSGETVTAGPFAAAFQAGAPIAADRSAGGRFPGSHRGDPGAGLTRGLRGAGRLAIATDFMDPICPCPLHRQRLAGQLEQFRRGQVAVSFAAGLQQGLVDAGPQADLRGRFDPQPGGAMASAQSPLRRWRRGAKEVRLDPLAVLPAGHPAATAGDPFTGADLGGMAHHRHQLAVAAGGA